MKTEKRDANSEGIEFDLGLKFDGRRAAISDAPPVFARHETFHPRSGWLKKGFDLTLKDPRIFLREDAPVVLGVGKNMVRAIRFWCLAFRVLMEKTTPRQSSRLSAPTDFGRRLLEDGGWDPYLENIASLWLLHWNLLKLPCKATAWYFAFNEFNKLDFSSEDLLDSLNRFTYDRFPTVRVAEASLRKDVTCLLRMYREPQGGGSVEDSIDSPFSALSLIRSSSDSRRSYFVAGPKPGLVPEIIVAASLEFAGTRAPEATTISISRLLYDPGSPGVAFKLTESHLLDAVEKVSSRFHSIRLEDTAGLIQLSFRQEPSVLARRILERNFR